MIRARNIIISPVRAVLLATGEDDRAVWESTDYHPNVLVFRIMGEALGLDLEE